MRRKSNNSGFTLLEVIIVIIIVGVLASLALPRFFSTVEYSRATEALQNLSTVRQSIERCYLMRGSYATCDSFANLDVEDPENAPNNHFTYAITSNASTYSITATRNTLDGGGSGTVTLAFDGSNVTKAGTGPFGGIQ